MEKGVGGTLFQVIMELYVFDYIHRQSIVSKIKFVRISRERGEDRMMNNLTKPEKNEGKKKDEIILNINIKIEGIK